MKLTAPGRAVYAWAKERASIFVRERLMESVRHTQLREFGDLPIGVMPDEFELLAREAFGRRVDARVTSVITAMRL